MSALSEQLNYTLDHLHRTNDQDTVVKDTDNIPGVTDIPEYKAHTAYFTKQAILMVRRIYRRFGGSEAFKDAQDALDRTEEPCMKVLLPLVMQAFADGIQLGQGISVPVKKHRFRKQLDQVFTDEGFRAESEIFCIQIMEDFETKEIIERYLRNAIGSMAAITAFKNAKPERLQKVWDLWELASNSAAVGMFSSGHAIGKQWAEKDALTGIVRATESADEKVDGE